MPLPWQFPVVQDPKTLADSKPCKKPLFSVAQNPIANFLLSNPAAFSFKCHLESAIECLNKQARKALLLGTPKLPVPCNEIPFLARISPSGVGPRSRALPAEAIEDRLSGVPVYALTNASNEFVLISGMNSGRSLGLFCFKRDDAEALLQEMKSMNYAMHEGSQVVAIALSKAFQLKVDGIAFRFIPDREQVLNAIKLKEKSGKAATADFLGVPVFQSRSLILRSQNKTYRPAFFRKEDLEDSLLRASHDQKRLNPSLKSGKIEVTDFEEIISAMKGSTESDFDDIVFVPPGFNIATAVKP